jgi:hypothetical protein
VLAASVMVAMLSAGTWIVWREVSTSPPAETEAAKAAQFESVQTELDLAEQHFTKAIATLEAIARNDSSALDGQTAEVLQTNLAVIDSAIGQSREALKAQPENPVAQESLFSALRSKVALLQDTVALINEMRKGNQEGAARIVSGMSQ